MAVAARGRLLPPTPARGQCLAGLTPALRLSVPELVSDSTAIDWTSKWPLAALLRGL
jgi:hypothetical protein